MMTKNDGSGLPGATIRQTVTSVPNVSYAYVENKRWLCAVHQTLPSCGVSWLVSAGALARELSSVL